MKKKALFFVLGLYFMPAISVAATCSQANLTRCLDSACAINVSSNPAARCQYCGTSSAGTPSNSNAMRSLTLGQSTKYILTEDELEDAPTDPGKRYAWATAECIKKIEGCTADDVSDVYDSLIEQSCKAAGISAKMTELRAAAAKPVSATTCSTDIRACMIDTKKCGPDFSSCETDAEFNNFFAACSVEATGCDDYISSIRDTLISDRDTAIANADKLLSNIVTAYQTARDKKLSDAKAACTDNTARETCIKSVCERSMPNKCAVGYESEKSAATQLCKFYDLACDLLK